MRLFLYFYLLTIVILLLANLTIALFQSIAGQVLTEINQQPSNIQECRENIDKVLKFMQSNSIKMHQTSSKGLFKFIRYFWA
jgi:hypothetical protein